MPRLLLIDQPTQVYFPSELPVYRHHQSPHVAPPLHSPEVQPNTWQRGCHSGSTSTTYCF
ncbi:hypothetical protein [Pseudomonas sp. S12(2018)]|uniref:hypothetical protein n=1 Tax=Pseudomonas sp. S12(2018) TaxID=2219664 RepID=UPI0020CEE914|nr:hypothetical protein [Pseudomonas sp. S12(2018)]